MKDRFDLEQEIMGCWNVVTDLKTVCTAVLEKDLSQDKIANLLMGLEELYQLKFESLFETFEDTISGQKNSFSSDSVFENAFDFPVDCVEKAPQCDDEDFMNELNGRGFTQEEYNNATHAEIVRRGW